MGCFVRVREGEVEGRIVTMIAPEAPGEMGKWSQTAVGSESLVALLAVRVWLVPEPHLVDGGVRRSSTERLRGRE